MTSSVMNYPSEDCLQRSGSALISTFHRWVVVMIDSFVEQPPTSRRNLEKES